MSRRPTDWATIFPKIIDKIENDHYSPSVAAALCGISHTTLSDYASANPAIRQQLEKARMARLGFAENTLCEMMADRKNPSRLGATIYFLKTQGREHGWSENNPAIVQNIVAVLPGVNILPSEKFLASEAEVLIPTLANNGHDNGD